jgi:DNA-binding HxlR family transcriptional regulator
LLKRLRLHGLLKKVPRCHKYYLTALGRRVIACCLRLREEIVLPSLAHSS